MNITFDETIWAFGLSPFIVLFLLLYVRRLQIQSAGKQSAANRLPASKQKVILLCGTIAFVLCGLFPPWLYTSREGHIRAAGCSFILSPPPIVIGTFGTKLDIARLAVEWLCIVAATGTVLFLISKPQKTNDSKS